MTELIRVIPIFHFLWIYPLFFIACLLFVRIIFRKINPKALIKSPPPLDPYSYSHVVLDHHYYDKCTANQILHNLIDMKFVDYEVNEAGTKVVAYKVRRNSNEIDKLHPLEKYAYKRIDQDKTDYTEVLKEITGYEFMKNNEELLQKYKNAWIKSGLIFQKKLIKKINRIYLAVVIFLFFISIIKMGQGDLSSKQGLLLIVELTFLLIATFLILGLMMQPKLSPRGKEFIENEKKELSALEDKTIREKQILCAFDHFLYTSNKLKRLIEALDKAYPYMIMNRTSKYLDDSLVSLGTSSCSSCSGCSSCSCSD